MHGPFDFTTITTTKIVAQHRTAEQHWEALYKSGFLEKLTQKT